MPALTKQLACDQGDSYYTGQEYDPGIFVGRVWEYRGHVTLEWTKSLSSFQQVIIISGRSEVR